jgi:hypothetical protein
VVWELAFGSWVLLQPERINAYAQAVIRTLQADEHQRACLMEERVLKGDWRMNPRCRGSAATRNGSSCWPCTRRWWSAGSPARQGERQ